MYSIEGMSVAQIELRKKIMEWSSAVANLIGGRSYGEYVSEQAFKPTRNYSIEF